MKGNMKKLLILAVAVGLAFFTGPRSASAEDVVATVPGTACVYFAGQTQSYLEAEFPPDPNPFSVCTTVGNSTNHGSLHNDTANWEGVERVPSSGGCPAPSNTCPTATSDFCSTGTAIVPPSVEVCGDTVSVSAAGSWAHGFSSGQVSGPGGRSSTPTSTHGEYNWSPLGISLLLNTDLNTLVGVFLTDDPPDPGATPTSLSGTGAFTTTPLLQQTFAIGAGPVEITIPEGATRLFFGLHDGYEWWNNGGSVDVTVSLDCLINVDIDIKPGSYPNAINLGSHGLIPVAILSSADFDATTVDPETVELAGSGVAVRGKSNKYMAHDEDVNGDGLVDLVVQVATENLDPESFQDGYAILTGKTYDGVPIEGEDEITIVPPESE